MNNKEIRITALLVLDTIFFLLEAIIGYSVHSLALIADSFHMLNDIISLLVALWAVRVKNTKPADGKYTYGWQRAEILGALINAVFLLALCFTIIIEAIQRFFETPDIKNPKLILIVGIAGLLSNGLGLVLFHEHGHSHGGGSSHGEDLENNEHGHEHAHSHETDTGSNDSDIGDFLPNNVVSNYNENSPLIKHNLNLAAPKKKKSLNMEGVFLHVLGDALGNVGVIITALFIWKTDYSWRFLADPVTSLVITVIIFSTALPLCRRSSKILLQATPPNIDTNNIIDEIVSLELVKSVHDFHVWNLNEDILIALLHVELNHGELEDVGQIDKAIFLQVVSQVREVLHKFGIHSATIQPEFSREIERPLNRKDSAYGPSNKDNCLVDDYANCDTTQCN